MGREVFNYLSVWDMKSGTWERVKMNGEVPKEGRSGHTLSPYKKGWIMFGGTTK